VSERTDDERTAERLAIALAAIAKTTRALEALVDKTAELELSTRRLGDAVRGLDLAIQRASARF